MDTFRRTRPPRRAAPRPGRVRAVCARLSMLAVLAAVPACAGGAGDVPGMPRGDAGASELILAAAAATEPGFAAVAQGFSGTEAGEDWTVTGGYGPSGDQSRKVARGMTADLVAFSVRPDMQRVVDAGVVEKTWHADATRGVPFGSVVALVVRAGNPLGIHGWDDLLRPGVRVVTPDPRSSGSAMWNMLAPYAAASDGGRDRQAGLDYVRRLVDDHVAARPASARAASEMFLQGSGDVLISYENEALALQRTHPDAGIDYVLPAGNIRIEYPFAVTARGGNVDGAREFADYMYSPQGQREWARAGFRPVDPGVASEFAQRYPVPGGLRTVEELGGWDELYPDLFAGDGAITRIYAEATR